MRRNLASASMQLPSLGAQRRHRGRANLAYGPWRIARSYKLKLKLKLKLKRERAATGGR